MIKDFIKSQENQLLLAIVQQGNFSFKNEHKHFEVSLDKWYFPISVSVGPASVEFCVRKTVCKAGHFQGNITSTAENICQNSTFVSFGYTNIL
jgi:hypothetical protein